MHILIIARHYPPEISGGARRPALYVRALRELGHKVTLVTPFERDDPDHICVPNAAISRGAQALNHASPSGQSPGLKAKLKARLREWAYWPDENIPWARAAARALEATGLRPDWILTTSPPESAHYAGAYLSKKLDVRWAAEMRDTWVDSPHKAMRETAYFRARIERRMARRYFKNLSAITSVSEAVMKEARKYVPAETPECEITHFSAPSTGAPFAYDASQLNLFHAGGFTRSDRHRKLEPLLKALEQSAQIRPELILHIAGPLSEDEIALSQNAKVAVKLYGSVSLEVSNAMQRGADGLVLYTPPSSHALPGKYAEYALSGRPIFFMGGGDWLSLVTDDGHLRPLAEVAHLQKQQHVDTSGAFTHIEAAQKLVAFLSSIEFQRQGANEAMR